MEKPDSKPAFMAETPVPDTAEKETPSAYTPELPKKREYTASMRLLLAFTLAMGLFVSLVLLPLIDSGHVDTWREFALPYAGFWAIYLAAFFTVNRKRPVKQPWSWFLLGAVALLFLRYAFYESSFLSVTNLAVIPAILMLHAIVSTCTVPRGTEGQLVKRYFVGWFVYPFSALGCWFGALSSLFRREKEGDGTRRRILFGFLIGIPVAGVVLALLLNADAVMGYYGSRLLEDVSVGTVAWRIFVTLAIALLFYSFLYNISYTESPVRTEPLKKRADPVILMVILSLLLAVYAVFAYFQFAYLTGLKGLPAELTYSEYAVTGFTQLCYVSAINLALFGFTLSGAKEHKGLKGLLLGLLLSTCVVLYSGIMRLSLYIGAYGLTINRILPFWFMLFLALLTLLCFVRLFWVKLPLVRAAAVLLVLWYLALNAVNLDAMVARSIVARADVQGYMDDSDMDYIKYDLSRDADAVWRDSRYAEEIRLR